MRVNNKVVVKPQHIHNHVHCTTYYRLFSKIKYYSDCVVPENGKVF